MRGFIKNGHGTGAGVPRVEVSPPDELPSASPSLADREQRSADGRFARGNTVQCAKLVRPGAHGGAALDVTSPAYLPFQRWGRRYATFRRGELAKAHGGAISAGVGALVESAALALAASRYLQMKAGESGDPDLFKRAADLANGARQNELAAWELAAREATARPRESALASMRIAAAKRSGT